MIFTGSEILPNMVEAVNRCGENEFFHEIKCDGIIS